MIATNTGLLTWLLALPLLTYKNIRCAAVLSNLRIRLSLAQSFYNLKCIGLLAGMLLAMLLCAAPVHAEEDTDSNLPVPRFVSLRSNDVNMRVGPGTRYSISWVYHRADWPVEIIQEFDQWREIRDSDGTTGWVHKQSLQAKRMALTKGDISVMRRAADNHSRPLLRIEPKVAGRVLECKKTWCHVQFSGTKGWLEKAHLWGVYPEEEF